MKIIGITGGVGAGKTALLSYIGEHYNCRIILADEASHAVMAPGGRVYQPLVELLNRQLAEDEKERTAGQRDGSSVSSGATRQGDGSSVSSDDIRQKNRPPVLTDRQKNRPLLLNPDGTINRSVMAALIFPHDALREEVNGLIHPAVRAYILQTIAEERAAKVHDYLFIEAALLIEEGYKAVVDELWYVYSSPEVRRQRLTEARHYSAGKIDQIMKSQLSDEEFRRNADVVIDNSTDLAAACRQIDQLLG